MHLKGVHTINLSYCMGITDAGLAMIRGVHNIDLSHCMQITDAGLENLQGVGEPLGLEYPSLHTINLYRCMITDAGLAHLKGEGTILLLINRDYNSVENMIKMMKNIMLNGTEGHFLKERNQEKENGGGKSVRITRHRYKKLTP